ncbi:MAG: hypothetical protein J6T42_01895 [Clostridia bacterium]|nr:hypothetical protein [Clostridia bacterium]
MSAYLIPTLIVALIVYAIIKKIKVYDCFIEGAKKAVPLVIEIFPYLAAVFIMCESFEKSGLNNALIDLLTPFYAFFGIPKEVVGLTLLKPFSGSGSLAVLTDVLKTHGADGYIGRLACVLFSSSETTFYVCSVYIVKAKTVNVAPAIAISLSANFIATVFAAFICRIL